MNSSHSESLAFDPLHILYQQGPCLAVLKPSGIPTQAPAGIESLETQLKEFFKARDNKTGNVYLGVPHRLDRPASGAMVFARHVRAAQRLSKQFEARTVGKTYWALVAGQVEPAEGTWQDHLRKIYGRPQAEVVPENHPDARLARLQYRTLAREPWGTWLEIHLETGRTHQIRIQAASRGYPVLGDSHYGSQQSFGPQYEDDRRRAIALHARELSFNDPMTRERVTVTAPASRAWHELLTISD